jgi:hypothetical protein
LPPRVLGVSGAAFWVSCRSGENLAQGPPMLARGHPDKPSLRLAPLLR